MDWRLLWACFVSSQQIISDVCAELLIYLSMINVYLYCIILPTVNIPPFRSGTLSSLSSFLPHLSRPCPVSPIQNLASHSNQTIYQTNPLTTNPHFFQWKIATPDPTPAMQPSEKQKKLKKLILQTREQENRDVLWKKNARAMKDSMQRNRKGFLPKRIKPKTNDVVQKIKNVLLGQKYARKRNWKGKP